MHEKKTGAVRSFTKESSALAMFVANETGRALFGNGWQLSHGSFPRILAVWELPRLFTEVLMPLLQPEPSTYPEGLLTDADANPAEATSSWWVLHTRPRSEKALARQLLRREISFFLPVCQRTWRDKGRLLHSYLPLFPGYLFLRGSSDDRRTALETNLVVQSLPVVDQAQLQGELLRIRRMIEAGVPLTPEDRLQRGTPVEITAGPLTGLQGTVLRRGRQFHFILEIHLLQQGVSVEIESWMFRPLMGDAASRGIEHGKT